MEKIVVNMGVSASLEKSAVDDAAKDLALITGRKPAVSKSRHNIANFKLRAGLPIGCRVTLRRDAMYEFFDRSSPPRRMWRRASTGSASRPRRVSRLLNIYFQKSAMWWMGNGESLTSRRSSSTHQHARARDPGVSVNEILSVQLAPMFVSKGGIHTAPSKPEGKITSSQIDVPLLATLGTGKEVRPFLKVGPFVSFVLDASMSVDMGGRLWEGDFQQVLKRTEFGHRRLRSPKSPDFGQIGRFCNPVRQPLPLYPGSAAHPEVHSHRQKGDNTQRDMERLPGRPADQLRDRLEEIHPKETSDERDRHKESSDDR
jgi:hypothetical protein